MAQGAATPMEDGVLLGCAILEVVRGVITIPEAISIYEKTRMPRVWIKQQASFTAGAIYMCSADNAVCQYLQNQGNVDSNTKVAKRVRDKWWGWSPLEGRANTTPPKAKL